MWVAWSECNRIAGSVLATNSVATLCCRSQINQQAVPSENNALSSYDFVNLKLWCVNEIIIMNNAS